MRASTLCATLAIVGLGRALVRRDDDAVVASTSDETAAKRYIIEFAEGTDHSQAVAEISSRSGMKVLKVFNCTDIFSGVSIETTKENADSLNALTSTSRVWPAKKFQLDPILDSVPISDAVAAVNYTVHDMTGVDKLHKAGIYGKGAVIAVVDTGVYYPHPDIGGGIGPGYTVSWGYDYVGDGDWPNSEKQPDNDPLDYVGHGTHVAGIIAAKSPWFTGVAPEATLRSYKVFSETGTTDEDTLIQAFLDAYDDGVDIITASIGGPSGWTDDAWAAVADRIVDAGVVVTIAAGNDGKYGPFFASSGSSGKNVLAVASVDPTTIVSLAFDASITVDGTTNSSRMAYQPSFGPFPPSIADWPIIPLGNACEPLPADTPSLANKLALITDGFCGPSVKEGYLSALGAEYFFTYKSSLPDDGFYLLDWTMQRGILGTVVAETLIAAIEAGASVTATFPEILEFVGVPFSGNVPSTYTSYGGTFDLTLKPDIAAPGAYIFSLYLNNGYATMSGTSMACPYVAGVAALYIGKNGGRSIHGASFAKQLSARILSSGQSLPWSLSEQDVWASPTQIGNGLINATKVLNYDTELSFEKFHLNDTHHFSRYQGIDITNHGSQPLVYTFEVQPAGAYEAFWPKPGQAYLSPRMKFYDEMSTNPLSIVPAVKLPSGKIEVKPGETKTAQFIFDIPESMNEENLPVFSGKVLVTSNSGEQLSVPYFGVGSNIKSALDNMWYSSYNYPELLSTTSDTPLAQKSSFSFNLSLAAQDFPKLKTVVVYGSKELRWDIFEESWKERQWTYPPVVGQNGYVGSVTSFALAGSQSSFDPATDDEDNLIALPAVDLARHVEYEFWWLGKFANGSSIVPGKYNMRIAALQPFGVPNHSDNWDVWETPMIEVVA